MSRKESNKQKRYARIFEDYTRLYFKEMKREEVIFDELAEVYDLTPDTIYRIVLKIQRSNSAA